MPEQEFRGLTLFAVLPGPIDAVETIDTLILTADAIARTLAGTVQDSQGAPLNAERIILMRDDAARFQASLAIH
jgi:FtsZ-interacting cell division protein ZipA